MKRVATLILNRNLPAETDAIVEKLAQNEGDLTDVYVIESGSDKSKLSKYCTWWENSPQSIQHALRFPRGFNFGLTKLLQEGKYENYDYFLLLFNDVEWSAKSFLRPLVEQADLHSRVGILAPCANGWGEKALLRDSGLRYIWMLNQVAWLVRREFVDVVRELRQPSEMNFIYDGSNFRGYQADLEIVMKGYINGWASAITTDVLITENKTHLLKKSDLIKTDPYEKSLILCLEEGREWLRRKYGYSSRWEMPHVCKMFYDRFFREFPHLAKFRLMDLV